MLEGLPLQIKTLNCLNNAPQVIEDGETFRANALKKAQVINDYCGEMTLADDSGLEVEALGGLPGVKSARFAGEEATDELNNSLLLEKLEGISDDKRGARFVCVLAIVYPDGSYDIIEETCRGKILAAPQGRGGFGYDPLFYYPPADLTFAQMESETKNKVSHRGKALRQLRPLMENLFSG